MSDKKKMIVAVISFMLLIIMVGTTYSFFNYTRTGGANTVRVGRISFVSSQDETINLSGVFPISELESYTDNVNTKTIQISVTGDTDYDEGIEYVVTASDVHITTQSGKKVPISMDVWVEGQVDGKIGAYSGLGDYEEDDYYANRENYTTSKYKVEYNQKLKEGSHILVGYIAPNTTPGTASGINDTINIKVYINSDDILITDTLKNGPIAVGGYTNETQNPNKKLVLTTEEWNSFSSNPISFKIKVEANEGIWVTDPNAKPVNECIFKEIKSISFDINNEACINMFQEYLSENTNAFCSGETIEFNNEQFNFYDIVTIEDAPNLQAMGIISNLSYEYEDELPDLQSGMIYVNGQYKYDYIGNGWHVELANSSSVDPVTTKLCTTINDYPITDMSNMFNGSQATSIDLSSFDTSNVTTMYRMFIESQATSIDLSSFDTSNVVDMSEMFYSSSATNIDLSSFDTSNVTTMYRMFDFSLATNLDLSSFDTSNVVDMSEMFYSSSATSIDLSSFDTSNVTTMSSMFNGSHATNLDLSNFDTSNVSNMSNMFWNSQATSIDLSSFDTSSVTDMSGMFGVSNATNIDLSSFDTSNVTSMLGMFQNSPASTIYVSNLWDTDNVITYSYSMFFNSAVVGQNGTRAYNSCQMVNDECTCTGYTDNPLDKTYARVDNPPDSPGYFTYKDAPNSKCYSKNNINYWGDYSKDNTYNLVNNVNDKTTCLS